MLAILLDPLPALSSLAMIGLVVLNGVSTARALASLRHERSLQDRSS